MKICKNCGILQELDNYEKYSGCKDGHRNQCKLCRKENRKKADYNNIDLLNLKVCSKCNIEKQLSEFVINKNTITGYRTYCKECANVDKRKSWHKLKNVEGFKLKRKECKEKYRSKEENKIKEKESYKRYNSLATTKNKKNNRQVERYNTDPFYKLKRNIKSSVRNSLRNKGFRKNEKTEIILGCSYSEFKMYIENQFENWMSWDNHGKFNGELNYGWDLDHIIPLDTAITEEDVIRLSHYTNFQPLCSKMNRHIKSNKLIYS